MEGKNEVFFVIGVLLLLAFAWLATGGPARTAAEPASWFVRPPVPTIVSGGGGGSLERPRDIEREFGRIQDELARLRDDIAARISSTETSPYLGMVTIRKSESGPTASSPDRERIELVANRRNSEDVSITGWRLETLVNNSAVTIQGAASLPYAGQINPQSDILLSPGHEAIITSGRSPIGTSFRTNKCTGYFEQFQDFTPTLERSCPLPENEFKDFASGDARFDEACSDFIDRLPRCQVILTGIPIDVENECRAFLSKELTYSGCVRNHEADADFFDGTWRVFLGRSSELWENGRDVIRLLDAEGRTVDVFSY